MDDLTPEQMKQRMAMLEKLVAERNNQLGNEIRDRKVAQSEAANAKELYGENIRLKATLKECQSTQKKLEQENRELKSQLGIKEHRDTMSRFQNMLDGDGYNQAGPVAAWERQKEKEAGLGNSAAGGGGGANPPIVQYQQQPKLSNATLTRANPLSQSRVQPGAGADTGSAAISSLGFGAAGSSRPRFGFDGMGGGGGGGGTTSSSGGGGDDLESLMVMHGQIDTGTGDGGDGGAGSSNYHLHGTGGIPPTGSTGPTHAQHLNADPDAHGDPDVHVTNDEVDAVMQRALEEAKLEQKDDDELEARLKKLMQK